jgi:hypothetical protein
MSTYSNLTIEMYSQKFCVTHVSTLFSLRLFEKLLSRYKEDHPMKVSRTRFEPSKLGSDRTRVSATIHYDAPDAEPDELWIDLPNSHCNQSQPNGDPWLAASLAMACRKNEALVISDPVDPMLLEGVSEIMRVWSCWYDDTHIVRVDAPVRNPGASAESPLTASFFSGGVDSFFTALWHDHPTSYTEPVDELLTVWGFDIPITNSDEIKHARQLLEHAAQSLNKPLVEIWTNIRQTRLGDINWYDSFGCALAAVSLILGHRYRRVFIGSGYPYSELRPCGSHVITDPFFSTASTRITHDAAGFTRMEKLRFLGEYAAAMDHLHVCWINQSASNCGVCNKCWRTMLAMEILGIRKKCATFDPNAFTFKKLRNLSFEQSWELFFFKQMFERVPDDANPELRAALKACIHANEQRLSRILLFERLECLPKVGWFFGHVKRAFVSRKRISPLPAPRLASVAGHPPSR